MPGELDARLRSLTGAGPAPDGFIRAVRTRRTVRRVRAAVLSVAVLGLAAGAWWFLPSRPVERPGPVLAHDGARAADPFAGLPGGEVRDVGYCAVPVRLGDRPWTERGREVTELD